MIDKEPEYIKLFEPYTLPIEISPVLILCWKFMTYADPNQFVGGQLLLMSDTMKQLIARLAEVTVADVDQYLIDFAKHDVFRRIDASLYQGNPYLFGKGSAEAIAYTRYMYTHTFKEEVM